VRQGYPGKVQGRRPDANARAPGKDAKSWPSEFTFAATLSAPVSEKRRVMAFNALCPYPKDGGWQRSTSCYGGPSESRRVAAFNAVNESQDQRPIVSAGHMAHHSHAVTSAVASGTEVAIRGWVDRLEFNSPSLQDGDL
jgi:hypothetical protein